MKNQISTVHQGNLAGRLVAATIKSMIETIKSKMTAPMEWVSEFVNGLVAEAKA